MTNTLITGYLSEGIASARPATPAVASGAIAFYYATDTATLSVWNGTSWVAAGGGYSAGSAPSVVQFASNSNGNASVTFGAAPTNGNLLVAIAFELTVDTPGSGWTSLVVVSTGTDYGMIFYKVAGASESSTQTPLSGSGTDGVLAVWEVTGQNATVADAIVTTGTQPEENSLTYNASPVIPLYENTLFLGALGLVSSSYNNKQMYNVVQDHLDVTGSTRQLAAGHATIANAPTGQIGCTFTGAANSKAFGILISN
jgi:hypothetical protein